jgi:hypothetical protein
MKLCNIILMYISYSLSFGEVLHHCLGVWDHLPLNQSLVCTVAVEKGTPKCNHNLLLASTSSLRCFNGILLTPPSILFHIDVITLSRMLCVFHLRCKSGSFHVPDKGKWVCAHGTSHIRRRHNHQAMMHGEQEHGWNHNPHDDWMEELMHNL